uniref:DNA repair protein REV1-like isoform X1 n=1 Tax=Callithrix jacchus TaxID=9483 RepID=UPI0023DD0B13|nr:DNA repair protein REV1-like isoform X1 [Callithrix jacchus]XP_054100510.1 DNA repair protein REV1-like isoform X1 [Callithrix jacchus]XP_054100511.1 DNA repair protein REV1-like isoform X1 [Callithrix jacchus]
MPTSFMPRCLIHSTHWCKKKGTLAGVGRSMESKLASLGIKTCGDLQYMIMAKLQKEFGPKTGQMLYRFCHGLDDRPVRTEKERKSVSAEINYGIRFTQVGIHVNQLVPADPNTSTCPSRPSIQSSHFPRGSHSVRDIFQVQKAMKSTEEEHKEVFLAAVDLEISSASRTCTFLPHFPAHLPTSISPDTNKTESSGKWNGLHSPVSVQSRLNLSIEVPSPSQLDQSVLEALPPDLPPDLREQVEQVCAVQQAESRGDKKKQPVNGCNSGILPQPVGTVLLQIPEPQESNSDTGINVIALPAFSQVFAALPAELQRELKAAYDQRQRQSENSTHQQPAHLVDAAIGGIGLEYGI